MGVNSGKDSGLSSQQIFQIWRHKILYPNQFVLTTIYISKSPVLKFQFDPALCKLYALEDKFLSPLTPILDVTSLWIICPMFLLLQMLMYVPKVNFYAI